MKNKILAILMLVTCCIVLLMFDSANAGSCGPKFPEQCQCGNYPYNGILKYVVNCTNTGLKNISVLQFMPEQTEILIFNGNDITELPWNILGNINDFNSLSVIDMSNNNIREIRGKSYHHVQNVIRLILNHNNLSISRDDDEFNHHHPRVFSNFINLEELHLTDAFRDNLPPQLSEDLHDIFVNSNLTKLRKLHLEQNEIEFFKDRKVFCDLPHLSDLHLGDNKLKEINFDVQCLKHLRFLDLERNKFAFVKKADLNLLNDLEELPLNERDSNLTVDFNLNPFICDCRLYPFHIWLQTTLITVKNKDSLTCTVKNHGRKEERKITLAEYEKCQESKNSKNTKLLVFFLVAVSIVSGGLLLFALIYFSRKKLKYYTSPLLDNSLKKVHYTSIRDDETYPEVHV